MSLILIWEVKFYGLAQGHNSALILRLHYVPGGHVSDNRDQNGITVRQCRGTG